MATTTEQIADSSPPPIEAWIVPAITDPEWMSNTACDPSNGDDLFPRSHGKAVNGTIEEKEVIARLCANCVVRGDCLVDALRTGVREGVRGGIPESMRGAVHDEYESSGAFLESSWKRWSEKAIEISNGYTKGERAAFEKREGQLKELWAMLEGLESGALICEDSKSLVDRINTNTKLPKDDIPTLIAELERRDKAVRVFVQMRKGYGRGQLVGVVLEAA